jgi:heme oxygenase
MILQRLREQTQPSHKRLESRLDLLERVLSLDRYRALLARFYGFYVPVEASLERLCRSSLPELQYPQRRKAHLLVQDMEALGSSRAQIDALPLCQDLPTLHSFPQALGCLYVLEGSTLGGQIISRHLHGVHGLDAENCSAFFRSYGPQVGVMWRAFGAALDAYPLGQEEDIIVMHAACETFGALETWLCHE